MSDPLRNWIDSSYIEALQAYNRGDREAAYRLSRQILAALPSHDGAMYLMGLCCLGFGQAEEAASWLQESLRNTPDDPQKLMALGMALKACGNLPGATQALQKAIPGEPANALLCINLANLLQDQGEFAQGLDFYRRAIGLAPDNALAHYNLGMTLLTLGQFKEGWAEAEWRWRAAGLDLERVDFKAPIWHGENLAGKSLLLWAEQGLGDTIMFCRYIPLLSRQGIQVSLQAPRALHPLLSTLNGLGGLHAEGDPLPAFDAHLPLLAVPGRLKTDHETIPAEIPYLQAPPQTPDVWRERLNGMKGLKVGLCWRGNPLHANDANRSLPTAFLKPLLDVADISWIGIQPDPGPEPPPIFNAGPELSNWGDTAGLVANLDLVIAVDSSTAHLAGALGKPCWLMLPYLPDWRWMLGRTDSPWYPSMTLFRQSATGDWPEVITRVRDALLDYLR
jgi:tetratricopeptide (TPR) repeat protein